MIKIFKFKLKVKSYRQNKEQLLNNYEIKKNKEISLFFEKIYPILKNFMNENSIKILIDKKNVIVGIESLDITNNILNILNTELK